VDGPTPNDPRRAATHVADLVAGNAARVPDQPAIVDVTSADTLSWSDLDGAVSAEAERLVAAGISQGDRVVVRMANGAAFCVALLGGLRAGAIVVPHGPVAVARELSIVFADCRPSVIIASDGDDAARASAAEVGAAVIAPPDLTARAASRAATGGGEDIALLVYASGTTGLPRGIRLSHRALLANRQQTAALRPSPVTSVDRVLVSLPLFHIFGLAAGFLQVCWAGATVVLTERFAPAELAEILRSHRVSAVAGVPTMYRTLLDLPHDDLRAATADLRLCTSGGAPLPPAWLAAFREATGLAIVEGYGLTEAGPVVTTNPLGAPPKPGSVGRALPGVELRLVNAEGRPIDVAPEPDEDDDDIDIDEGDEGNDTGLVAVRGPNLFSGYWPDGEGGPDADGWFRTADVGFLDADGDLHLVDRSSDVVIVNGFNVYPREVEQVLLSIEGVTEAAVVGQRDERAGEVVKAVLVVDPAAGVDEEAVRAYCAQRLARFKVPAVITFVDALPRTPTGKIARRQLALS
jgi:long-chain acyl-CoA synthetase